MLRARVAAVLLALGLLAGGPARLTAGGEGDNTINGIGPVDGKFVKLRTGFKFTEGPAADSKGNVYFSDIPNKKIYKVNTKDKIFLFRKDTDLANGLAVRPDGQIVACEMAGYISVFSSDGEKKTVLANQYNDKRFNAPNDLVLDREGGIYFTDPEFRAPKPLPQGKTCVFYVAPDRKVTRLIDNLLNPNGIRLSPDQKTLYVFPSGQPQMVAYPVLAPGRLGKGRKFCTVEPSKDKKGMLGGDGGAVDSKGNVYIATARGIQVFSPQGERLGLLEVPEPPSNMTFGGADFKTLFVTARTSVYTAKMLVAGAQAPEK
jgi:gluconolactonase